jgi:hypothetical protein
MVTKNEIGDFSGLNPDYLAAQAEGIVFECKKLREEGVADLAYIQEKAENISRFVRDVSLDIEKCRAHSMEELIDVFKRYLGDTRKQAKNRVKRGAWKIEKCPNCGEKFSLPVRLEVEGAWCDCCPFCYKPIEKGTEVQADV